MSETLESAESASPLITRLVAGALAGRDAGGISLSRMERLGLRLLDPLPVSYARKLAAWRVTRRAIPARRAMQMAAGELCRARLADYDGLDADFPVVLCGSALGGATAHLASALGGPFLPQPFILGLQGGTEDDHLQTYLERVVPIAEAILHKNPQLSAIAHFDPVHDGWLTRSMAHLRLKLIGLPLAYREFLQRRLRPGGTILYLDCRARWLQYARGDRFRIQVGGWGDIPAQEFLTGSDRIDRFLAQTGSQHSGGWSLEGLEARWEPESEWGSQPGLDRALEDFARQEGYRYESLRFDHPHNFSKLAYRAHRALLAEAGIEPRGVLIEMFTQYTPWAALERGLLPLWLVFNTHDSLEFLKRERSNFPANLPIFLNALVTLSRTPDMVTWDEWAGALDGFDWRSIGARRDKYPEDLPALSLWLERLRGLSEPLDRIPNALSVDELLTLAADLQASL